MATKGLQKTIVKKSKTLFHPRIWSVWAICLCCMHFSQVNAQGFFKKLFATKKDTTKKASLFPFPMIMSSPETGVEMGGTGLYSFYTDRKDTAERISILTLGASMTTKKQLNIKAINDIWTKGNKFHITNEIRYRNFPINFFGTGGQTLSRNKLLLDEKLFRINVAVDKNVFGHFYSGFKVNYDRYRYHIGSITNPNDTIYNQDHRSLFYVAAQESIDSRDNNTYTSKGVYLKVVYGYAPGWGNKDNYKGSFLYSYFSSFKSFGKNIVWGMNANYLSILSRPVPFYIMPQLGNDQMMRGFYQGRYRNDNLLAVQTELRWRFHPRLAVVGFAGLGSVYGDRIDLSTNNLKFSRGAGVRYFFDTEKKFTLRIDYAIAGKAPNEQRQRGFYLAFGEAF
ncbi:MAG: polymerase [Pseudopedobacter saltans]|uniref:Polymerase n=1 Tax=Pseudopedobacter saltans TaxID=151895 RepID=A0A2W5EYB8_9SPHI|nr:MAG: polymerase [Pseudopedobacter saltans]